MMHRRGESDSAIVAGKPTNKGQLRSSRTLAELRRLRLVKGLNFRHPRDSSAAACDHNPLIQISLTIDCICDSFAFLISHLFRAQPTCCA
jgi:hypothetical protein